MCVGGGLPATCLNGPLPLYASHSPPPPGTTPHPQFPAGLNILPSEDSFDSDYHAHSSSPNGGGGSGGPNSPKAGAGPGAGERARENAGRAMLRQMFGHQRHYKLDDGAEEGPSASQGSSVRDAWGPGMRGRCWVGCKGER